MVVLVWKDFSRVVVKGLEVCDERLRGINIFFYIFKRILRYFGFDFKRMNYDYIYGY